MSKEEDNKAIVGRWFTEFWGEMRIPTMPATHSDLIPATVPI